MTPSSAVHRRRGALLLLVLADANNAGQGNGAGRTWRRFFDLINDGIIMVLLSRL